MHRPTGILTDIKPTNSDDDTLNYGILVDCGSSGSRVFVYFWPPHSGKAGHLLNIQLMRDSNSDPVIKKVEPGEFFHNRRNSRNWLCEWFIRFITKLKRLDEIMIPITRLQKYFQLSKSNKVKTVEEGSQFWFQFNNDNYLVRVTLSPCRTLENVIIIITSNYLLRASSR